MKKFCAKIALYMIVSVILLGINGQQAVMALDQEEIKNIFSSTDDCITEDDTKKGYITTFIEEPLDASEDTSNSQFQKRICYRQTLQYSIKLQSATTDEKPKIGNISKISRNGCSSEAQSLADQNPPGKDPNNWIKYSCREIQVLLSKGGTTLLYGYIGMIYRWGASMVGIIAVLLIVVSGIQISAAGGDPEAINKAKTRILQSIGGIIVLFLSGLILYTVNPNFFVK